MKMFTATKHNGEKIYHVDMNEFGYINDEDTIPGEAEMYEEGEWPVLVYWDGNNWQIDFLESEPEEIEYELTEDQPEEPNPSYYGVQRIEIDEEEIEVVSSNMSGNITPYWVEYKGM